LGAILRENKRDNVNLDWLSLTILEGMVCAVEQTRCWKSKMEASAGE
jgi:hypothetical protein